jgi:hypothetical protein
MKIKINDTIINTDRKIRIETEDYIFDLSVCPVTKNLIINKVDGIKDGNLNVLPKCSNVIEVK